MYKVTFSEFMQYRMAERRLNEMKLKHEEELQQAYDNIKPTITAVNYDLGQMYVESIDPADYAIYLVELQQEHKRQQRYWEERAKVYKQAVELLSEHEKQNLDDFQIRRKLMGILGSIIAEEGHLRRNYKAFHDDTKEYDKHIDNMTEDELLQEYDDFLKDDLLREQCVRLRDVHDMTYDQISRVLGITVPRVKRIIRQHVSTLSSS